MKLADLRKLSIRQNLKIRFRLANGLECVITEHGVAQIPELHRAPDFNLEQELVSIGEFVLQPLGAGSGNKHGAGTTERRVGREELESMAAPTSGSVSAEREDE